MTHFEQQRSQMVEQQLRHRGIRDEAVLEAMTRVPRHQFVSPSQAGMAYSDIPLPIGYGQTISQPYIVAYMTEAAGISSEDIVLEIGTGSGYEAAILGQLAKEVYTIEVVPELAEQASRTLADLGYQNVFIKKGDGNFGWKEHAPYDAILVTAAPDRIPESLEEQLVSNGKLVIPVGTWFQDLLVLQKTPDGLVRKRSLPVQFVPLVSE
ncbi:MAG: protein-L-isoaspartate(D-aspartate) O-methyltransferase [Synechococcus sp.]